MARQNYKAEKRRRELEKKRKKEAKREKRLHRAEMGQEGIVESEEAAGTDEQNGEESVDNSVSDPAQDDSKE